MKADKKNEFSVNCTCCKKQVIFSVEYGDSKSKNNKEIFLPEKSMNTFFGGLFFLMIYENLAEVARISFQKHKKYNGYILPVFGVGNNLHQLICQNCLDQYKEEGEIEEKILDAIEPELTRLAEDNDEI